MPEPEPDYGLDPRDHWIRYRMPVLLTYNSDGEGDEWARVMVRGDRPGSPPTTPTLRRIVLQGTWEADRVWAAIANGRYKRGQLQGGASIQSLETAINRGEVASSVLLNHKILLED